MSEYRNPLQELLSALPESNIHAWDLTREFPDEYTDWQYEANNGDTLLGFVDWLKDNRGGDSDE